MFSNLPGVVEVVDEVLDNGRGVGGLDRLAVVGNDGARGSTGNNDTLLALHHAIRNISTDAGIMHAEGSKPVAYLLAVYTALISLDGDELLAADGETIGESLVTRGVGSDQGVDLLLGELYSENQQC